MAAYNKKIRPRKKSVAPRETHGVHAKHPCPPIRKTSVDLNRDRVYFHRRPAAFITADREKREREIAKVTQIRTRARTKTEDAF